MTEEKVIWSSPRKGVRRTKAKYSDIAEEIVVGEASAKKSRFDQGPSTTVKPSDLNFCLEVAELMNQTTTSDQRLRANKDLNEESTPAFTPSAMSLSRNDGEVPNGNEKELTCPTDSRSLYDREITLLGDIRSDIKPAEIAPMNTVNNSLPASHPGLGVSKPFKDTTNDSDARATPAGTSIPNHWSYIGVSFQSAVLASSCPTSSASIDPASFLSNPIPCSPLSPWYLSNGIPNFSKQVHRNRDGLMTPSLQTKSDNMKAQAALISPSETALTSSIVSSLSFPSVIRAVTVPSSKSAQTISLSEQSSTSAASTPLASAPLLADHDPHDTCSRKQKRREEEIEEEKDDGARGLLFTHQQTIRAASDTVFSNNNSENVDKSESKRPRLLEEMSKEVERTKLLESRLLGALIPKSAHR